MKTCIFKSLTICVAIMLATGLHANAQEKVLQSSLPLGEADFEFETFYKIIDCGNGDPVMFITAFNEGGRKTNVAFDIQLKDKKTGFIQEIKVPFFYIKFGDMYIPSCDQKKYDFLKHKIGSQIDYTEMEVKIKYYSK